MAPHSSTLAWKIPWTEELGRLQSVGSLRVNTTEQLHFDFSLSCIGEGNGNPLQSSCLENPRNGGVWWPAIYGVAQSRTRLKRHSSSSSSSSISRETEREIEKKRQIERNLRPAKWRHILFSLSSHIKQTICLLLSTRHALHWAICFPRQTF